MKAISSLLALCVVKPLAPFCVVKPLVTGFNHRECPCMQSFGDLLLGYINGFVQACGIEVYLHHTISVIHRENIIG